MNITLETMSFNNCTVGKLYVDSVFLCYTMEKPWEGNEPMVSCVPGGVYELNPCISPRFGETYCLENPSLEVSLCGCTKRTHILFHKANMESQLLGCIAPVSSFGVLDGKGEWCGLSSGKAYNKLIALLDRKPHTITIIRS
jgi:hypothetical protein